MSEFESKYILVLYENNDRLESAMPGHGYESQSTAITRAEELRKKGQRVGINKRVAIPGHADVYKLYGPDDALP